MITLPLPSIRKALALGLLALTLSGGAAQAAGLYDAVYLGRAASQTGAKGSSLWAFFTFGTNPTDTDSIVGSSLITGDVAVAGNGKISLSGGATVNGDLYQHQDAVFRPTGGASLNGNRYSAQQYDTLLDQGVIDAKNASTQSSGLTPNQSAGSYNLTNTSLSLTATGGKFVMNLSDLTLDNTTLTLNGSASDYFVFNIGGTLSVTNGSNIVLNGGLTPNNVLFNYTGTQTITLQNSILRGIVLAASPTNYQSSLVSLSGNAGVIGELIANKVTISGGSSLTRIVSP